MSWQPIETAPSEIHILVACAGTPWIIAAYECEGAWYPAFDVNQIECEPTHWMPLPEPPR